jgi:hypothetical protein
MKSALPLVLSSMVATFCRLASGPLPHKTAGAPSAEMVDKVVAQITRTTNRDAATLMERFGEMVAGEWILEGRAAPSSLHSKARFEKGRTVIKFGLARLSLIENMHTRSDSGVVDDALGIFWCAQFISAARDAAQHKMDSSIGIEERAKLAQQRGRKVAVSPGILN